MEHPGGAVMDIVLDDREVRVLGCLIEKEITTPEYYPLSLNALTNACNQKSNRNPVASLSESAVTQAIESLKQKRLVRETLTAGSRVTKYLHEILDQYDLSSPEMALLCELMLRGPQTLGELRSNADRMFSFGTLADVQEALAVLTEHDPPLAVKLSREPGRKESRYMHLLSGTSVDIKPDPGLRQEPAVTADDLIIMLQDEIAQLRSEIEEIKRSFSEFKSQF